MPISFNSDSLSTGLKKINPSALKDFSGKAKTANINTTISDMTPQIKDKVTNAVNNFKDLKTGSLPEVSIPQLDVNAYTEPLDGINSDYLNSLSDVKGKLNAEKLKKEINIENQLADIDVDKISTNELSKFQGDILSDVKANVSDISNTQLRDFNTDIANQQATIDDISNDVISNAKVKAEKGVTDIDKALSQNKSIDSLDNLVDKKNIFI